MDGLNTKAFDDFLWRGKMEPVPSGLFNDVPTQRPQTIRRKAYTKDLRLSADNVCAILDSCFRNSVTKFSFGGLEVEFETKPETPECEAVGIGSPIFSEDHERQGRREHLTLLADTVDDELEMLKITDPMLYEKMMVEHEAK
jgi:hypothetical protein